MIQPQEHGERMRNLQVKVRGNDLQAFLVTAQDSIYYLTGVTYAPLERPFFILVRPDGPPTLLAPALDQEHLSGAPNVGAVQRYWDYPSPAGEGWPERLRELVAGIDRLGIEPTLPQEIAVQLADIKPQTLGLVEQLRIVKSPGELIMLRQASQYADLGGFRHSDTVLVTRDGYEKLTHFPADLAALTLTGANPLARLRGALVRKAVGI